MCTLSQTAQDYLGSSDSEGEADGNGDLDGDGAEGKAEEDADRREEARVQKLWVKRAKRRRVLAEVEQGGDSQGPGLLMEQVKYSWYLMMFFVSGVGELWICPTLTFLVP